MANVSQNVGINSVCFAVLHGFGKPSCLLIPLNLFQQCTWAVYMVLGRKTGQNPAGYTPFTRIMMSKYFTEYCLLRYFQELRHTAFPWDRRLWLCVCPVRCIRLHGQCSPYRPQPVFPDMGWSPVWDSPHRSVSGPSVWWRPDPRSWFPGRETLQDGISEPCMS